MSTPNGVEYKGIGQDDPRIGVKQMKGVQQLVERDHKSDGREHDADQDEQADNGGSLAHTASGKSVTGRNCQRYIQEHHPGGDDHRCNRSPRIRRQASINPWKVGCGGKKYAGE